MQQMISGPDFLGIGAPRCGTTFLFKQLVTHDKIWIPSIKEIHYFDNQRGRSFLNKRNLKYIKYSVGTMLGLKILWYLWKKKTVQFGKYPYEILFSIIDSSVSFGSVIRYMVEYYYENGDVSHTVSRDEYITKMISKLSADFEGINGFIKITPLKSFIRYLYKDLHYEAVPLSGGEEWFSVYKNHLKEKIDKKTFSKKTYQVYDTQDV